LGEPRGALQTGEEDSFLCFVGGVEYDAAYKTLSRKARPGGVVRTGEAFFSRAAIVARLTSMWAMQEHREVSFFVIFAGAARKNHACEERRRWFLSDLADFATVVFFCDGRGIEYDAASITLFERQNREGLCKQTKRMSRLPIQT
jgi:hypothetical protein